VLNLNLKFIRNNRLGELDGFKEGLNKRVHLTKSRIEKLLSEWRGDQAGELKPHAPVMVHWLKKRAPE